MGCLVHHHWPHLVSMLSPPAGEPAATSSLPCSVLQAHGAIKAYGVHLVVGNMLHTRKDRVYLVRDSGGQPAVQQIERPAYEPIIEKLLVAEVVVAHRRHMEAAGCGGASDGGK